MGGAALAGHGLLHRTTRDLDVFWHEQDRLDERGRACEAALRAAGLSVEVIQGSMAFRRLRVADGSDVVVVDLVAEPGRTVDPPELMDVDGSTVRVATRHDLLVDKLCALLGRSEVRDLVDVHALLQAGGDLDRALRDAPLRDAGFSPLTLAWVLRRLPVAPLGAEAAVPEALVAELERFRDDLVRHLVERSRPA